MLHQTRIEPALALGGYAIFCDCGNLTGFAYRATEAAKIAARHVVNAAGDDGRITAHGRITRLRAIDEEPVGAYGWALEGLVEA